MCRLRNIAMRDYRTDAQMDGQTDAVQSDPYVRLCFACDTKMTLLHICHVQDPIESLF